MHRTHNQSPKTGAFRSWYYMMYIIIILISHDNNVYSRISGERKTKNLQVHVYILYRQSLLDNGTPTVETRAYNLILLSTLYIIIPAAAHRVTCAPLSLCPTPPRSIHTHAAPPRGQPSFTIFIFKNCIVYIIINEILCR